MGQLKFELRAWLIEIVREAIRKEFPIPDMAQIPVKPPSTAILKGITKETWDAASKRTIKPHPIVPVTDFEQMQAESIQAQEDFYAPQEKR